MNTPPPDSFDRALAAYAAREQARSIPLPAGFTDRATAAALARPRWAWVRWAVGLALVGLVAVGGIGYAVWPTDQPPAPQPLTTTPEPTPPNLGDTFSEAGNAVAKLTRTTAEKATPPRALLPPVESAITTPAPELPAGDTLASVPAAAKTSLEPVAGSTRRAFHLFLRDTGLGSN